MEPNKLRILGIRGIPARHGGFETFAEQLAIHLVGKGWDVSVYCQENGEGEVWEDEWNGVKRIHIPVRRDDAVGTVVFDWKCVLDASRRSKLLTLTLGYNTAVFLAVLKAYGVKIILNMDGIEWRREKWSVLERGWLWVNERVGALIGDHLVADHPGIARHLCNAVAANKITTIAYGAFEITKGKANLLAQFGVFPNEYVLVIARPEPENSILEIVKGFSRKKRGYKLLVLGTYSPEENDYHGEVLRSAGEEVIFGGAIYEKEVVQTLRFFARIYVHGHRVGGTNPSLVEALGAGSAVLAHRNEFNIWVAGSGARYFSGEDEVDRELTSILGDDETLREMGDRSRERFKEEYTWDKILGEYEELLAKWQ